MTDQAPRATPARPAAAIRAATPADVPVILDLIRELAEYEKFGGSVRATEDDLHATLFAPAPAVFAHVAEHDHTVVGMAIWYVTYSTWLGRHGIYLEDLYVRPQMRGYGYGRALIGELARICVLRDYGHLQWSVLDWNAPAIGFYEALGAFPVEGWTVFRLTGTALGELGRLAEPH